MAGTDSPNIEIELFKNLKNSSYLYIVINSDPKYKLTVKNELDLWTIDNESLEIITDEILRSREKQYRFKKVEADEANEYLSLIVDGNISLGQYMGSIDQKTISEYKSMISARKIILPSSQ